MYGSRQHNSIFYECTLVTYINNMLMSIHLYTVIDARDDGIMQKCSNVFGSALMNNEKKVIFLFQNEIFNFNIKHNFLKNF